MMAALLLGAQTAHAKKSICGGLNQKACPKFLPGPQCKQGLRKVRKHCRASVALPINPGLGRPGLPAGKSPGAATSVNERAKRAAQSAQTHIRIMQNFAKCIGRGRNRKSFISASKRRDADAVARLNRKCLSRSDRRRLATATVNDGRGNQTRFRSYTVGLGASLAAVVGAGADAGWAFDLERNVGPRFYTAGMAGVGIQLMGGADILINLSVDEVKPGVSKYSGSITSLDVGTGVGVGFITERSKRMLYAPFKGIEVAIGVGGVGGSIGSKYSIRQRLWRKACKNVTVRFTNMSGDEIKIIDLDYRDQLKSKWRSEPTPNKVIKHGQTWSTKRWFGKVGDERTQFKVKFRRRKRSGFSKWEKITEYRFPVVRCRNDHTYSAAMRK
jgi:hypothetical protein